MLVLEDDERLRRAFVTRLRSDGYVVRDVGTLQAARDALRCDTFDCLVLDRMVPDGDGLDLVAELQARAGRAPMLVLSGLDADDQRVDGLWAGADDYVAKPVCLDELSVRVAKVTGLDRTGTTRTLTPVLRVGAAELDRTRRELRIGGSKVRLTRRQYGVLEYLMVNSDQVVLIEDLLEHCWDGRRSMFNNPVASQVTRLRAILRGHVDIQAVRGSGYLLQPADAHA